MAGSGPTLALKLNLNELKCTECGHYIEADMGNEVMSSVTLFINQDTNGITTSHTHCVERKRETELRQLRSRLSVDSHPVDTRYEGQAATLPIRPYLGFLVESGSQVRLLFCTYAASEKWASYSVTQGLHVGVIPSMPMLNEAQSQIVALRLRVEVEDTVNLDMLLREITRHYTEALRTHASRQPHPPTLLRTKSVLVHDSRIERLWDRDPIHSVSTEGEEDEEKKTQDATAQDILDAFANHSRQRTPRPTKIPTRTTAVVRVLYVDVLADMRSNDILDEAKSRGLTLQQIPEFFHSCGQALSAYMQRVVMPFGLRDLQGVRRVDQGLARVATFPLVSLNAVGHLAMNHGVYTHSDLYLIEDTGLVNLLHFQHHGHEMPLCQPGAKGEPWREEVTATIPSLCMPSRVDHFHDTQQINDGLHVYYKRDNKHSQPVEWVAPKHQTKWAL